MVIHILGLLMRIIIWLKKLVLILEKNDDFSLSDIVLQNDEQASASSMTGIIVIIIVVASILIYLFVRHKLQKNNDF